MGEVKRAFLQEDHWSNARKFVEYASCKPTQIFIKDSRVEKAPIFRRVFYEIQMFWNDKHFDELQEALKGCLIHINQSKEEDDEYQVLVNRIRHYYQKTQTEGSYFPQARLFSALQPCWPNDGSENSKLPTSWTVERRWVIDRVDYGAAEEALPPEMAYLHGQNRYFFPISKEQVRENNLLKRTDVLRQSLHVAQDLWKEKKKFFVFHLYLSRALQKIPLIHRLSIVQKIAPRYFSKEERRNLDKEVYSNMREEFPFSAESKESELKVTFLGATFCLIQYKHEGETITIATDPLKGKISSRQKRRVDEIPMEKLPKIDLVLLSNPQKIDVRTLEKLLKDSPIVLVPKSKKKGNPYIKNAIEGMGFSAGESPSVVECRWEEKVTLSLKTNDSLSKKKIEIYPLYSKFLPGRNAKSDGNASYPLTYAISFPHVSSELYSKRAIVHFVGDSAELPKEMMDRVERVFNGNYLAMNLQGAGPHGKVWIDYNHQPYEEAILSHLSRGCPTLAINRGVTQLTPTDTFSEGLKTTIDKIRLVLELKKKIAVENISVDQVNKTKYHGVADKIIRLSDLHIQKLKRENPSLQVKDSSIESAIKFYKEKMKTFVIPKIYESKSIQLIDPVEELKVSLGKIQEGNEPKSEKFKTLAEKIILFEFERNKQEKQKLLGQLELELKKLPKDQEGLLALVQPLKETRFEVEQNKVILLEEAIKKEEDENALAYLNEIKKQQEADTAHANQLRAGFVNEKIKTVTQINDPNFFAFVKKELGKLDPILY